MIGLDTPVLLRLLRGDPKALELMRTFRGEELATTEWNLLELESLARSDPSGGRERRRASLENLRRRITVIPLDERSTARFAQVRAVPRSSEDLAVAAMLSALEARGCRLWITHRTPPRSGGHWTIQVKSL